MIALNKTSCQVSINYDIITTVKTVKELRNEIALSIEDLAKVADVSINTIRRAESNLPIRPMNKRKIAKSLHCKPQDILWK